MTTQRLVLHFDVNKTLIMCDYGINVSHDAMINGVLSDNVWGVVRAGCGEKYELNDWELVSIEPSREPPKVDGNLVPFYDFMHYYLKLNRGTTKKELHHSFSEPGQPGARCRPIFENLIQNLKIPTDKGVQKDAPPIPDYLSDGFCHILPSFFELIKFLSLNNFDYFIIFRTYGADLINIIHEFNLFCCGKHPFFSLPEGLFLDGSHGSVDRRVSPPYDHIKLRRSHKSGPASSSNGDEITFDGEPALIFPHASKKKRRMSAGKDGVEAGTYEGQHGDGSLGAERGEIRGARAVYEALHNWFDNGVRTIAISDDYEWWRSHGRSGESGKLLLVDPREKDREIQIFFDDNIERHEAHIVDARDLSTFSPLPYSETQDIFLRRVEPYLAITDKDYYVKEVQTMVEMRTRKSSKAHLFVNCDDNSTSNSCVNDS